MSAAAWESGVGRLGAGPTVPLARLILREHWAGFGWSGWGRVRQADRAPAAALFARAQEHGLVPGAPVMLTLSPAGGGPVRSWPSILTDLEVRSGPDDVPAVFVRLADPLTHLGARPLHAVFEERSPGQIVIGSLARVAGARAEDGPLRFAHPSLPDVCADERVCEDLARVPCAIACGEPLLEFVRRFLAEIGVRIGVRGLASGEVRMELSDGAGAPDGDPDDAVRLAASFAPETGEGILNVRRLRVENVSPDPHRPPPGDPEGGEGVGAPGSVAGGPVPRLSARSEAPGIRGGGRVELTNEAVADTREWRVLAVTHRLADRAYANVGFLERYGASPGVAPAAGGPPPRTLTAAVDESGSGSGAPVAVDADGRLRVRLASDPRSALRLPYVVPCAGAVHGFAPACCRGDRVRVRVHGPLRAEIVGALWSEALAPDEEARGAAHAMHIAPGLGAAFHPAGSVPEMAK